MLYARKNADMYKPRFQRTVFFARTKEGDHTLKVAGKKVIKTVCGLYLTPQTRRPFKWIYVDWQKKPCDVCVAIERKKIEDAKGWGQASGFTDWELA